MNLRKELEEKINKEIKKEESIRVIIIRIKDKFFAIELELLTGVGKVEDHVVFPIGPKYIKGIQFTYGNLIVLFDIMEILEESSTFPNKGIEDALFVIVKYEDTYFGILLNELINTKELLKKEIVQVPQTKEFYKGTFRYNAQMVYILDLAKIIEHTYEIQK